MTDTVKKTPSWAKRTPMNKVAVAEQLNSMAGAAYACAKATTDDAARAGYMDRCHALREAVRLLGS